MNRLLSPSMRMRALVLLLLWSGLSCGALAKEATPAAADPALEARMLRVAAELRCLVCQNQTIADSHADLADDLRREIRSLMKTGASDEEVLKYMTDRYGDFVLYRPPVKPTTYLLWFGPALLLVGGMGVLAVVLRRRSSLRDDQFEADGLDDIEVQA